MAKKLILFPFGGNAREALLSVLAINRTKKTWSVVGFIDDEPSTWEKESCGVKVLGDRKALRKYPDAQVLAVPGNPGNYLKRKQIIESLGVNETRFVTIIDPSAVVSPDAVIGYNTVIMPNVVVTCAVSIGKHSVILPNTSILHNTTIGDYCCIGSNVSISGKVKIGRASYIGSGAKIRENIVIGERTLIGLGANVVSDIESGVIAVGNPARPIKKAE
jgi:sugar O-acyltransferase (sialic acid O-acetyltransferase NeuD family)